MESWATPRPMMAYRSARVRSLTAVAGSVTVLLKTVMGRKNASWSISWMPPGPAYCAFTCPESASTLARSSP